MGSDFYKYRCTDDTLEIKMKGDLKYFKSYCFDQFVEQRLEEYPVPHITIDLSEAEFIDSTNLGLIAKVARLHDEKHVEKVKILSPCESVNQVLLSMGFESVFEIELEAGALGGEFEDVPEEDEGADHIKKTIYKSHKLLSDMNGKNEKTFKSVIESMEGRKKGPE
jgi:anti-anti-sigma factor